MQVNFLVPLCMLVLAVQTGVWRVCDNKVYGFVAYIVHQGETIPMIEFIWLYHFWILTIHQRELNILP